jgi:predicted CXXCH cytochrome family protein
MEMEMKPGIGRNTLAGLAVGVMALLTAPTASAGTIVGSNHDLSGKGYGTTQICIFCHTPHNALTTAGAPLWNHTASTATYTVYASPTMNATVGQPGTSSKLCLSCHDGTVAVDSYGGRTGTTNISAGANFGTALSNDHPIGFTYDATLATADGSLANPATKTVTIGSAPSKTGSIASTMLIGGVMECASCHDVHNTFTAAGGGLLKISQTAPASALCLACHNK